MPGENLQKLNKEELEILREVVRRVYFEDFTPEMRKILCTDYECDKLIDSLLPETVEKLREAGVNSEFANRKKFFLPSTILSVNGQPYMVESD